MMQKNNEAMEYWRERALRAEKKVEKTQPFICTRVDGELVVSQVPKQPSRPYQPSCVTS